MKCLGFLPLLHAMTAMISTATPSASPASPPSSASANPEAFRLPVPLPCILEDQTKAQAITVDTEATLDADGFVALESTAKWNRDKIMPLYARPLRAWVFDPVGADSYRAGSLEDVTARIRIPYRDNRTVKVELDLGPDYAGKRVFLLAAHYFNHYELYEGADWWFHRLFDSLADVPLSGAANDEFGYMSVNAWGGGVFRGRFWSDAAERHWREALGTDYARLLFDMRRAPDADRRLRVRALQVPRVPPRLQRRQMGPGLHGGAVRLERLPPRHGDRAARRLPEGRDAADGRAGRIRGVRALQLASGRRSGPQPVGRERLAARDGEGGILDGAPTEFDFVLDGVRYSGHHTGILAVRDGRVVVATSGGELHVAE